MHEKYLESIGQYEILNPEEEREIAVKMRNGDKTAREMLINSNLGFVMKIARQYSNGKNFEDLVQGGNMGLVEATERFNPDLGYRFITYASYWILREIIDYYKKNESIRLSAQQKQLIKETNRIIQRRSAISGEGPDLEYIAKILGPEYSVNDVQNAIETDRNTKPISLNKRMGDDSDHELLDSIGIDGADKITNEIQSRRIIELVRIKILSLNIRDDIRSILMETLIEGRPLKQICKEMGISMQIAKQKYDIGIRMLKRSSNDIKKAFC